MYTLTSAVTHFQIKPKAICIISEVAYTRTVDWTNKWIITNNWKFEKKKKYIYITDIHNYNTNKKNLNGT